MKKDYRFSGFGFGFGFPPFGFRFYGPWRAGPRPFPRAKSTCTCWRSTKNTSKSTKGSSKRSWKKWRGRSKN